MRNSVTILFLSATLLFSGACRSAEQSGGDTSGEMGEEKTAEPSPNTTAKKGGADGTGCVAGDCQNGQGTYVWPGGSKYVGQFKDGLRDGAGTYTWASGSQYVGQYKKGLRDGSGAYNWSDGHSYIGEFQADQKHGKGVYTWPDGTVFEGVWTNNERGEGTFSKLPGK